MPRPKIAERRDCQLNFSLTQSELTTLRTRADAAGLHLVDYGRAQLLRQRTLVQAATAASENALRADRLVVVQLRRLGNLLNQLVRRCHARDEPLPATLASLLSDLRAILTRMLGHGA